MTRPPFQKDAKCPKCDNDWLMHLYQGMRVADRDGEYLQFRCPSCGYEWQTQTADAQPQPMHTCGDCLYGPEACSSRFCPKRDETPDVKVFHDTLACKNWRVKPEFSAMVLTDQELFAALMVGDVASIKRIRASHERLRQLLCLRDAGLGNDDGTKAEIQRIIDGTLP